MAATRRPLESSRCGACGARARSRRWPQGGARRRPWRPAGRPALVVWGTPAPARTADARRLRRGGPRDGDAGGGVCRPARRSGSMPPPPPAARRRRRLAAPPVVSGGRRRAGGTRGGAAGGGRAAGSHGRRAPAGSAAAPRVSAPPCRAATAPRRRRRRAAAARMPYRWGATAARMPYRWGATAGPFSTAPPGGRGTADDPSCSAKEAKQGTCAEMSSDL